MNAVCLAMMAAPALVAVLALPAAAQENHIMLSTDRDSYMLGDDVVVWGSVSTVLPGEQMQMKVLYGDDVIMVDQFEVAADGSFARRVSTGGQNWDNSGSYVVRVWYGSDNISREFEYVAEDADTPTRQIEVADGRGSTFDLGYAIRGGTVDRMVVDYDNMAILVEMESDRGGDLLLDLPRRYINATEAGDDTEFIVLAGDQPLQYVERDTASDVRRIWVAFPPGTSEILVIGTEVVPEFGAVAVLLVAVGGAVAASRFRTRIFP